MVSPPGARSGLSLIELMIAITLGMLVVAALLALFLNITRTNNEMAKLPIARSKTAASHIQLLQNDLRVHAGFWGARRFASNTS
jgi:type IV pilus assembly protein PilW